MKIAITADLHLNPKYPERGLALSNIFEQMRAEGIRILIIAGDLFDKDGDDSAYPLFIEPCRSFPDMQIHLIPGNHDSERCLDDLNLENLYKHKEPEYVDFEGVRVLFVPYKKEKTMGEIFDHTLGSHPSGRSWVLVGHGDFIDGMREPNPREKGIYMPLRKSDLGDDKLKRVFLGHIHKPTPLNTPLGGKVIYPGSPQGLDISETGHRRFLVLNTENLDVSERVTTSGVIYFDWKFFIFPSDDEFEALAKQLEESLSAASWKNQGERMQFRLKVEGFTKNKDELISLFTQRINFLNLSLYEPFGSMERVNPDFDSLLSATDIQRNLVAQKTIERIESLSVSMNKKPIEPSIEEIKMAALKTIYQLN